MTVSDLAADRVVGYFYRPLLDDAIDAEFNAERSGLIHVDRYTAARTLKDSARWYTNVITQRS